jgi:hypothetical protein
MRFDRVDRHYSAALPFVQNRFAYPLMKLAHMYFWQIGYEAAALRTGAGPEVAD